MYQQSITESEVFWAEQAKTFVDWHKTWQSMNVDVKSAKIKWFNGGKLNVSYNCIDRHLANKAKIRQLFGKVMMLTK